MWLVPRVDLAFDIEGLEQLQILLNLVGFRLVVDGILGPATQAALDAFGASRHIVSAGAWDHARLVVLASEAAARRVQLLNADSHP